MAKKHTQLVLHSSPLAFGILLSYFFWESNMLLLVIYVTTIVLLIVSGEDKKVESWILVYGMFVGFMIETIGTNISGYQNFTNPDILGIPYWLVVAWGYGFVLMKRVSLIIATGTPWARL